MPNVFIETPTTPSGSNAEKLDVMYRYLLRMSEQLNDAMTAITVEQTGAQQTALATRKQNTAIQSAQETAAADRVYNSLKSMIIKTAKIVRSEMDVISTNLHAEYEALDGEFGDFTSSMDTTIKTTAEGVLMDFNREEKITERISQAETDIGKTSQDLAEYVKKLSQYIFMGQIDEDHVGIAIGNNVTGQNENQEDVLIDQNKMATFTMDELAFFINGVKAAWYSGTRFHIAQGQVTESLMIGQNHVWRVVGGGNIALCSAKEEELIES